MRVQPDKGARNVIIKVTDSGVGIPKEKRSGLFQPFNQVGGWLGWGGWGGG